MAKRFVVFFLFFLLIQLKAHANFNYDANCVEAYNAIISLKINEAKVLIQKEKQQNPQNGIIILLENYVDYFSLLASENKADYEKLKDNKSTRISALESNDKNSPFYLFSQAEVYLQWGMLKGKFGDFFSSGLDIKKAGSLLKENAQKYPDFVLNQKSIALVNVIFGSIPASLKSVTFILGMSGNVPAGIKRLEDLRVELQKSKYSFYDDEVVFLLCNIDIDFLQHRNNYVKLESYISGMNTNSLLKSYLQGYIAAKTSHNDEAVTFFEGSPNSNQYIYLPAIDYYLGSAKLNRMDADAPVALSRYVREYKGNNYVKDTYLKLGYFYLLQNDLKKYEYYLTLVRTKGNAFNEKDQQALREANDSRPDTDLLRSRFYYDGGYYDKALNELKNKDVNSFKLFRDKIEYFYRLGRIYESTDKLNDAMVNYQKAITFGKSTKYYFAANAAVRMGKFFEEKRDFDKAASYYNMALDMKDHEYKKSIDNEATQGLKRINK
jgi:hypothetical protein